MKSPTLKIIPILFGLFIVGVSFGSFTNVAQAYWSCAGGYETQAYSCVTDSIYWPGGYYGGGWCGYGAGYYDAGTYYCYGTCYQQVWNPNINCTWIPDCTTAYGSTSCNQNLTQYGVPSGYTVGTAYYSYNTCNTSAVTYLGYSCSPSAPTSVSISSSVANPVYTDQSFTVSWSQSGGTGTISYTLYVDYVGYDWGSSTVWSSSPGGTAVGDHIVNVRACNSGGCTTSPSIIVSVINRPPIPSTPSVSITPNPVGLNQTMSVSWATANATSYNYKVDGTTITTVSPTATSLSGTPASLSFTGGSHTIEVRACNATGCSSYGIMNFNVTTAPTVSTFTANSTSLQAGGGPVTLTWTSINTTKCVASNGWSGDKPTSGSQTISVSSTATYDITCY